MRKIISLIVIIFSGSLILSGLIIPLKDLERPDSITIHKDRVYITDQGSILIYNLKDLRFIKKFGKIGEGPGEFKISPIDKIGLRLSFDDNRMLVSSMSKLSWFFPDGILKEEKVVSQSVISQYFHSMGGKLIGYTRETGKNTPRFQVNLYDPEEFKLIKTFHYMNSHLVNGKVDLLRLSLLLRDVSRRGPIMLIRDNHIIVEGDNNQIVEYDSTGQLLKKIDTIPYSRVIVTAVSKKAVLDYLKKRMPGYYKSAVRNGYFPEYFPVRSIQINKNNILVQTFKMENGKSEFLVIDAKGKYSGSLLLPFGEPEMLISYPFTIFNGNIYQLTENEESEEWQLSIYPITE
ncbi:MAG: hypothetical protein KAS21_06175 [Candidatus Aminicenantes bacterium]|nr:hypothetical protein [Candidatus Aminicenantes bacterium]